MTVLAFGAHPDDLEILCGGTLAKCAARGDEVHMAVLARGQCGSATLPPDEIAAIREQEAHTAAEVIGATLHWLGSDDLNIAYDQALRERIIDIIRIAKPDVLITHAPNDYMEDHRAASRLVEELSMAATIPNIPTAQPPHPPMLPIYHMDTVAGIGFEPEVYVDIGDHFETKRRMLACHESQTAWLAAHDQVEVEDMMVTAARFRGFQAGVTYAEGFRVLREWGRIPTRRMLP